MNTDGSGRNALARAQARAVHPWLAILAVAVAYYLAGRWGLSLTLVRSNVSPIWPPTGVALVGALLFGVRVWPGIAVASLLINLPISPSATGAGLIAAGNTVAPLVATFAMQRLGFRLDMARLKDAVVLVLAGALGAMTISASVGTAVLVSAGVVPLQEATATWTAWWTGDVMGVLAVGPLLLVVAGMPLRWPRLKPAALAIGSLTGLGLLTHAVFLTDIGPRSAAVSAVMFIAIRFGVAGAASASLLVSSIATFAAINGWGPFDGRDLPSQIIALQTFNGTISLSAFVIGAITSERNSMRSALETSNADLDRRVSERTSQLTEAFDKLEQSEATLTDLLEFAPDAILVADDDGRIVLVNAETTSMFRRTREDLLALKVEDLIPVRMRAEHEKHRSNYRQDPQRRPMGQGIDLVAADASGREFPVAISISPLETKNGTLVITTVRDMTEVNQARELRVSLEGMKRRQSQALELNDEIVQGLIVLKYRLASQEHDDLRAPLDRTLAAARSIIDQLLRDEDISGLKAGDLRRNHPALRNGDE